jgi:hypothetical protein
VECLPWLGVGCRTRELAGVADIFFSTDHQLLSLILASCFTLLPIYLASCCSADSTMLSYHLRGRTWRKPVLLTGSEIFNRRQSQSPRALSFLLHLPPGPCFFFSNVFPLDVGHDSLTISPSTTKQLTSMQAADKPLNCLDDR